MSPPKLMEFLGVLVPRATVSPVMAQSRSGSVVGSDRPVSEGKRTKSERRPDAVDQVYGDPSPRQQVGSGGEEGCWTHPRRQQQPFDVRDADGHASPAVSLYKQQGPSFSHNLVQDMTNAVTLGQ